MMINKPTRLGSLLIAVLLVLMPAQPLLASVAILNVQPGPGGKPIVRSVTKETVTGDRFETNEKEIQQVLLSDGTSLTLGPGSTMVIESFTYDPQTQSGQLSVRLERGQFRIVGGLLNNTGNIAVQTPSGKLDLDNASVFVEVQSNGVTRASLLHGKSLKMTTNGKSETSGATCVRGSINRRQSTTKESVSSGSQNRSSRCPGVELSIPARRAGRRRCGRSGRTGKHCARLAQRYRQRDTIYQRSTDPYYGYWHW